MGGRSPSHRPVRCCIALALAVAVAGVACDDFPSLDRSGVVRLRVGGEVVLLVADCCDHAISSIRVETFDGSHPGLRWTLVADDEREPTGGVLHIRIGTVPDGFRETYERLPLEEGARHFLGVELDPPVPSGGAEFRLGELDPGIVLSGGGVRLGVDRFEEEALEGCG